MADQLDDLRKLSPRERMARLKQIEEEKKREIEEATRMMAESAEEAKHDDLVKEIMEEEEARLRKDEKEKKEKKEKEDEAEEANREKSLERKVEEEEITSQGAKGPQYRVNFNEIYAERPNPESLVNRDVYNTIEQIRNRAAEGRMTEADERMATVLRESIERVEYVPPSMKKNLTRSEEMLEQIEVYKTKRS